MSKRPTHHRPQRDRRATHEPFDTRWQVMLAVWLAIGLYLVLFFRAPLASLPTGDAGILRRIDVLQAIVVGDEVVQQWFTGATWQGLGQRVLILAMAAAIFLVACAAGWICLQVARVAQRWTWLERFVFSAAIGLNLVSLATLALGLGGLLHRSVFLTIGAAILASAGGQWFRRYIAPHTHPPAKPGASYSLQPTAYSLLCCLPFVLVILLGALLPPVDFDVREYHLQAPKEFFQQGRIGFLPHNVYANMPLGAEMLSLTGMVAADDWWTGALVGKTLIGLFAPLGALVLLAAGSRFVSPAAGAVAAVVYISIPWIGLESMHGLIESALAFYLIAALFALMLWRVEAPAGPTRERLVWLAGFLAGSAAATKYPGMLFCVLPLGAAIAYLPCVEGAKAHPPVPWLARLRPIGGFALFVVLACGLWFAKNAALTGNPVYPLLYDTFGGSTRTVAKNVQWIRAHAPPNSDLSELAARAVGFTLTSDWLSPLLVPLAALSFLTPQRRTAWRLATYVAFVFCTWWLLTHRIDRFWVPVLPVVALMAGIGAVWSTERWWRVTLLLLLGLGLLWSFIVLTAGVASDNRFLASYELLDEDPRRVNPWHAYLNEHAGEVSGVLLVGDAQPFDLRVPAIYNTVFDNNLFEQIAKATTPQQVRDALAQRNVSHVYVDWGEVNRYRSPGNYGMTAFVEPGAFQRLVDAGVLARLPRLQDNANELYRVLPSSPERPADGSPR